MIGGMAVQVALADVCGDPGYEDCWEDCPLPDPMEFNHNALFHALYAAGLLSIWPLFLITLFQGFVTGGLQPFRLAITPRLVEKELSLIHI